MTTGIILQGEQSPIVGELSEALKAIGLTRETTDRLTPELLAALNTYRIANSLPELDFADPNTLRSLGIECSGDEVLTLARYGEAEAESEIGIFDRCREAVTLCRKYNLTIREYTKMPSHTPVSEAAVTAAILALLY